MTIHLPATGVSASAALRPFPAEGPADSQHAGAMAFQVALEECQQPMEGKASPTETGFASGCPQQRRNPALNGEKSEEPVAALIAAMAGLASPQASLASTPKFAAAGGPDTDEASSKGGTPEGATSGFVEQIPLSSMMPADGKSVAATDQPATSTVNPESGAAEGTPALESGEPEKTKQRENDSPTPDPVSAVPQQHDLSPATTRSAEKVAVSGVRPARGSRQASKDSADRTREDGDPNTPVSVAAPVIPQIEPGARDAAAGVGPASRPVGGPPADPSRLPVPPEPTWRSAAGQEAGPTPAEMADKPAEGELTAAVRASEQPAETRVREASVPHLEETRRADVEQMIPDAAAQSVARSSQFVFRETAVRNSAPAPAPEGAAESARTLESQSITEPAATTAPRRPANGLSIELGQGTRARVALHVTERAGEVRVAVRAADPELAHNIRQSLPELVSHLEQSGFRAEGWHPAAAVASTQATSGPEFQETRNGDSQQQQPGWSQQDRGQRGHEQGHRPEWVEELESTRTSAGSGSTGEWNGFGN